MSALRESPFFVGRAEERRALIQARGNVAWISGVGGIGKTTLVRAHTDGIRAEGGRICWLPCESINPSLASVHELLQSSLQLVGVDQLSAFGEPGDVLVIDGAESLGEALEWLFSSALPIAQRALSIIVTSRMTPPTKLLGSTLSHISLRPFTLAETQAHLHALGATGDADALHAITKGHPLANALAVREGEIDVDSTNRALDELAGHFVSRLDVAERSLCELLSLQRSLDVAICSEMLPGAPAVIEKLERFSFFHRDRSRLRLHSTIRDALYTRFRALHPTRARDTARDLITLLIRRAKHDPESLYKTLMDAFFCVRGDEALGRFLSLQYLAKASPRELTTDTLEVVAEAIARHEGAPAAEAFVEAFHRGDVFGLVLHDANDEVVAVEAVVDNLRALRRIADTDEIAGHMVETVERAGLEDEVLLLPRYFFALDTYQDLSAAMGCAMLLPAIGHANIQPSPSRVVFSMSPPPPYRAMGARMNIHVVPDTERSVRGVQREGFVAEYSPLHANQSSGEEVVEYRALFLCGLVEPPGRAEAKQNLTDRDWIEAVRAAMRVRGRPLKLKKQPLLAMCGVEDGEALFERLTAACDHLADGVDYADAIAAFRLTFLDGGMKQEAAAAELGLAYGTYRYRLRRGIELVAEQLANSLNA